MESFSPLIYISVIFKYSLIVSKQWFSSIEEVDCTSNHFLQPKVLKSSWRECISICRQRNWWCRHIRVKLILKDMRKPHDFTGASIVSLTFHLSTGFRLAEIYKAWKHLTAFVFSFKRSNSEAQLSPISGNRTCLISCSWRRQYRKLNTWATMLNVFLCNMACVCSVSLCRNEKKNLCVNSSQEDYFRG